MPYSKVEGHDECDEGQIAVVKDSDGEVMGCHDSEADADDQIAALHASEEDRSDDDSRDDEKNRSMTETDTRKYAGKHRSYLNPSIRFSSDDERTTVKFLANELARDGLVLRADGLSTENYMKNPVVLWDHGMDPRRGSEPIATTVDIQRNGDGTIMATIEWEPDEFAQNIKDKVKRGTIGAASVSWFTPDGAVTHEEVDGARRPVITESDMTELSIVGVPSDPDALVTSRALDDDTIAGLQQEITELKTEIHELRAGATASTAPDSSSDEATADSDADEVPVDAPERQGRTREGRPARQVRPATEEEYERLLKRLVPLIRTSVKRQLGKA